MCLNESVVQSVKKRQKVGEYQIMLHRASAIELGLEG